jgi:predicted Na+-dependent transporter
MADSSLMRQQRWLEDTVPGEDDKDALATFSAIMSNILLFFLIFGLSATVQIQNLKHQLTNKFAIFTGVAMQFLIMPFLGFCAVMMLQDSGFSQAMGISLLVVTASPGGSYSNWWCSLFNAELALSVAMTSVSSILSVGLLPANLFLYTWLAYTVIAPPGDDEDEVDVVGALDFEAIFITLAVVLVAILFGLFIGYKYDNPKFHARANHFGSICGIALILFSTFLGSGAGGAETNFWSMPWSFYVGVAFPCVVGMALANIIARSLRLSPPETVAISIECCYQNTAIATSVAVTMFTDPTTRAEAVSVPLFYGFVEAVIIGIYCLWAWKVGWTKAPANEKLCVVITKTYEVDAEELDEVEFDTADETGPKSWWNRLFEPRVHGNAIEATTSTEKDDKDDPRDRFYSADTTVATASTTSPPGTPETVLETIPQEQSKDLTEEFEDLEAPPLLPNDRKPMGTVQEVVQEQIGEPEHTEVVQEQIGEPAVAEEEDPVEESA